MCKQAYRGPRTAGPTGVAATTKPQRDSWFDHTIKWGDTPREVLAARIYFGTDDWRELDATDRKALIDLARAARNFLVVDRGVVRLRCQGRADVRGETDYNQRLSEKRAEKVMSALKSLLAVHPGCRFLPVSAVGETFSVNSPAAYADDRRVDVFVQVTRRWDIEAKNNPWALVRGSIFRKFYPHYSLWRDRKLEYLVDDYEFNDQKSVSVHIRPLDDKNALELACELARITKDPAEGRLRNMRSRDEIRTAYEVEYRKAYEVAHRRYEEVFWGYWKAHPGLSADEVRRIVLSR